MEVLIRGLVVLFGLFISFPLLAVDYCKPRQPCWPSVDEWKQLGAKLVGKLEIPQSTLAPCRENATSEDCVAALKATRNPYFLQDQVGGTENTGWLGGWTASLSAYAVAAEDVKDIVAAVNFAAAHKLKLVIKNTGHDYLGRSNAPDSLLVWTHKLRKISMQDAFVARGCSSPATPAVTLEAGVRWLEAYQEVTVKSARYVQGGGCTSVGAAGGFLQGGGFGSWSKKYGTAASNLLEAEIVTADGKLVVANACQNSDLFWALRGGGGGTYGIVTKVTYRTHALPKTFGWITGKISAKSDAAFKELLEKFLRFYRDKLNNENWGEQVTVKEDNSLALMMSFQDITEKEAENIWAPFLRKLSPERFTIAAKYSAIPAGKMWDYDFIQENFPEAIEADKREGNPNKRFWWSGGDAAQVSLFWYAYLSRWIPSENLSDKKVKAFAETLFQASRHWPFEFHFNKGQAGASKEALKRGRETAMNPVLYKAFALLIIGAGSNAYPGIKGHEPDLKEGESQKKHATAAMQIIRKATPNAGSYVNETDYFEPDWQKEFWGANYKKLLAIKLKYDPERMFTCHHCVGSE